MGTPCCGGYACWGYPYAGAPCCCCVIILRLRMHVNKQHKMSRNPNIDPTMLVTLCHVPRVRLRPAHPHLPLYQYPHIAILTSLFHIQTISSYTQETLLLKHVTLVWNIGRDGGITESNGNWHVACNESGDHACVIIFCWKSRWFITFETIYYGEMLSRTISESATLNQNWLFVITLKLTIDVLRITLCEVGCDSMKTMILLREGKSSLHPL